MNCQQFEGYLVDLAGERVESESLRASLLQHAGQCSRCASLIAAHRDLASGLRALAGAMVVEKASDRVEQVLRQQLRKRVNAMTTTAKASPAKKPSQSTAAWVGLVASVLVLVGWALVQLNRESGMDKVQVVPAPRAATDSRVKPASPVEKGTQEKPPQIVPRPARPGRTQPPRSSKPVAEQRVQVAARTSRVTERSRLQSEGNTTDRIETEFLPFMVAGPRFASEQRQFVRVKLPRSALQVFGLPMNMERAREPVQADVLLGEDGRALAVRFVRE